MLICNIFFLYSVHMKIITHEKQACHENVFSHKIKLKLDFCPLWRLIQKLSVGIVVYRRPF